MQKTSTGTLIILFFAVAIAVVACGDNGSAKEAKMIEEMTAKEIEEMTAKEIEEMTAKELDELLENDPEKFGRLMKKVDEEFRKQREKDRKILEEERKAIEALPDTPKRSW